MSQSAEFIFEIYCEDIPARMQKAASDSLYDIFNTFLYEQDLSFLGLAVYTTSRRLTVHIAEIQTILPEFTEEKKGPKTSAPDKAIEGFLKSNGLNSKDELIIKDTDKGECYFAEFTHAERNTSDLMKSFIREAIKKIHWPKSMNWGENTFRFVRPILNIMCLLGGKVVEGEFFLGHDTLQFNDITYGHPFLSPNPIKVENFLQYKDDLALNFVALDPEERKKTIERRIKTLLKKTDWVPKSDNRLLEEITNLVEWPYPVIGNISPNFMALPEEVLITVMRHHQKYIALNDAEGQLLPRFIIVANIRPKGEDQHMIHGHEKVIEARFNDAHFYYNQDITTPLSDFYQKLSGITYHAKLGTMFEKTERMKSLAHSMKNIISPDTPDELVDQAAKYSKADLTSGMVGEFPELQGVMGSYYAKHHNMHIDLADALKEHYQPLGPDAEAPSKPLSVLIALSDKIDHLVSFFAIGLKPTGSKDPFALRRSALGILRILIENKIYLPLREVFQTCIQNLNVSIESEENLINEMITFMRQRLNVMLKDQGISQDIISAIPDSSDRDDFYKIYEHIFILKDFIYSDEGEHLLTVYRRANNIVSIEQKKNPDILTNSVQVNLLKSDEEKDLFNTFQRVKSNIMVSLEQDNFEDMIMAISGLRPALDDFFDNVLVNDDNEDLRLNRLCLLGQIRNSLNQMADFSKIEKI